MLLLSHCSGIKMLERRADLADVWSGEQESHPWSPGRQECDEDVPCHDLHTDFGTENNIRLSLELTNQAVYCVDKCGGLGEAPSPA